MPIANVYMYYFPQALTQVWLAAVGVVTEEFPT